MSSEKMDSEMHASISSGSDLEDVASSKVRKREKGPASPLERAFRNKKKKDRLSGMPDVLRSEARGLKQHSGGENLCALLVTLFAIHFLVIGRMGICSFGVGGLLP